jgi:hypothetical protein
MIKLFFIIFYLFKIGSSKLTIGNFNNSTVKLRMFIDIKNAEGLNMMDKLIKVLEDTQYQAVEQNNFFLSLHFISEYNDPITQFIIGYINYIELISEEFENCFTCYMNKFYRVINFVRYVIENMNTINESKDLNDFIKFISQKFPYLSDKNIFEKILSNKKVKILIYRDKFLSGLFSIKVPFMEIDGIFLDFDTDQWKQFFEDNFKHIYTDRKNSYI